MRSLIKMLLLTVVFGTKTYLMATLKLAFGLVKHTKTPVLMAVLLD